MTIQLSAELFLAVCLFVLFLGCWWSARLVRSSADREMLDAMIGAYKQSADVSAGAAKRMMESQKTSSDIIEQVGGILVLQNPKDTLDKFLVMQAERSASFPTAAPGVSSAPARHLFPSDNGDTEAYLPEGVRRPEDM